MDWLTVAGIVVMLSGSIWKRVHESQARHMHDYGDRERNKYELWK